MKKLLCLLLPLVFLVSCTGTAFTVTMQEVHDPTDTVTFTVTLAPPPNENPEVTINGVLYQVISSPTVSDQVYVLETAEEDGMHSVTLRMQQDSAGITELHMLPEEGAVRVYLAPDADAFAPLLNRTGQN